MDAEAGSFDFASKNTEDKNLTIVLERDRERARERERHGGYGVGCLETLMDQFRLYPNGGSNVTLARAMSRRDASQSSGVTLKAPCSEISAHKHSYTAAGTHSVRPSCCMCVCVCVNERLLYSPAALFIVKSNQTICLDVAPSSSTMGQYCLQRNVSYCNGLIVQRNTSSCQVIVFA